MAITLIKTGAADGYEHGFSHKEYLLDTKDDAASLMTNCAPGSFAYTADLSVIYIMNSKNTWVEAGGVT